MSFKNLEGRSG